MGIRRKSKSRGKHIRRRQSKRGGMEQEEQTSGFKRDRGEEGKEERNVAQRVEEAFEQPEVQQALAVINEQAPVEQMVVVEERPLNIGVVNESTNENILERTMHNMDLLLTASSAVLTRMRERATEGLNAVAQVDYPRICAQTLVPIISVGGLIAIGNSDTLTTTLNSALTVSRGAFDLVWQILSNAGGFVGLTATSLGRILGAGGRDAANSYRLTMAGINMMTNLLLRMVPEGQRTTAMAGTAALAAAAVTSCVYDERAREIVTGAVNEFMTELGNANPLQYLTMGHPDLIPVAEIEAQQQEALAVQEQAIELQTEEDRQIALTAMNTALQQLNQLVQTVAEIKGTSPQQIRRELQDTFNTNLARFEEMSDALMREPETIRLLQQIIVRRGEGRVATQTDLYSDVTRTANSGLGPRRDTIGGYRRRTRKSGKRRRRQTHKRRRHRK
uniref:Uncharacterized protein n=1 Tax=viral metagenome TaxID=1070528 RepID=A0A6C0D7T7_9ZZZZ